LCLIVFAVLAFPFLDGGELARAHAPALSDKAKPNILFVLMDDVGIDQMRVFGYGGATPPKMPNINAIALVGVRFRNTWSMPECSPSRAALLTGRYPLRNNIYQAIGPNDLANSQVSPYEITAPRVLRTRGYTSALFGKFHLGGPENNPFGNGTPQSLGFDYFYGYVGGLPGSIDRTAGGVAPEDTYQCGFVTDADFGACHYADGRCQDLSNAPLPGKICLERGGILVPNALCANSSNAGLNFDVQNAYYVSPVVENRSEGKVQQLALSNARARKYRSTLEVDAARDWINRRDTKAPWMVTVSFSADHTPIQSPPNPLLSEGSRRLNNSFDCSNMVQQRGISDRMIEAMDTEFGRLLLETGMARRDRRGHLTLTAKGAQTMIVIAGDNGSLGTTVKQPLDLARAKGTPYQTGIWVPVIVSGPLVKNPNRDVEHMTNIVDIFQLFGEIAGVNVHRLVPRTIDSRPMLPYLTNPSQPAIRSINFTQAGMNIQTTPYGNGPCQASTTCSQIPVSKSVCEDNGGIWWGKGADDPSTIGIPESGLNDCCDLNRHLYAEGQPLLAVGPSGSAVRNARYKLVINTIRDYDPASNSCVTLETPELYEIDQAKDNPKLDRQGTNFPLNALTPEQDAAYQELTVALDAILSSQPTCPGDGNMDGVVDQKDLEGWQYFVNLTAKNLDGDAAYTSSVFDFDYDGLTDTRDRDIIQANLGKTCAL
jgi:hypothetical protein